MKGKGFSYYVYYRVRESAPAKIQVMHLLDEVCRRTGIRGRLLVGRTEPDMWMEVYEGVEHAPAFERELCSCLGEIDFSSVLAPKASRKLECFSESCA
ncbi:MAG: DUF4936 family protein [Burkholderiales bacterium]